VRKFPIGTGKQVDNTEIVTFGTLALACELHTSLVINNVAISLHTRVEVADKQTETFLAKLGMAKGNVIKSILSVRLAIDRDMGHTHIQIILLTW
jgi:hypothetical protein